MSNRKYKEIEIFGVDAKFIKLFTNILPGDVRSSDHISVNEKGYTVVVYKFESDKEIFPFKKLELLKTGFMTKVTMSSPTPLSIGVSPIVNKYLNEMYNLIKGISMPLAERDMLIETLQDTNLYTSQKNTHAVFMGFPHSTVSKINEFYDGCLTSYSNSMITIKDSSYYFVFNKAELLKKSNDTIVVRVSDEKNNEVITLINFIARLKTPLKDVDNATFEDMMDDITKNGTPKNLIQVSENGTSTALVPLNHNISNVSRVVTSYKKVVEPFILPKFDDHRDEILANFVNLTEYVVPNPYEKQVIDKLMVMVPGLQADGFGNLFISIGESETLFSSHLDTVGHKVEKVTHTYKDGCIATDGHTILGGDNKAGVTIMIYMIKNNIPGLYYFFLKEERGRYGSIWVFENRKELLRNYKRAIAFDRREKGSIITFQRGDRTASEEFGHSLIAKFRAQGLEYRLDPTGSYTDTASFVDIIPECTNLSAGVYGEHGNSEKLNVEYFLQVCEAAINIDWELLSTVRKPGVKTPGDNTGVTFFRGGNPRRTTHYSAINEETDEEEDDFDDESDNDYYQFNHAIRSAGKNREKNTDIPSDIELMDIWNSTKTTIEKVHKLSPPQREEAIDTWKESKDNYNRMNRFLINKGFSSKDNYGLNKPILYKYRDNGPDIILMLIPDEEVYFNQTVIKSQADMIAEVDRVLNKNKNKNGKKKEIGVCFPVEYNESETLDGGYVLDTKEGELETNEFISNYGGTIEALMFFTTLGQINRNNVYYWPAWYKILLSSIDTDEIRSYKSENLSKLVEDKWGLLIKDTNLDKTTLAYAMRDKKIQSEFSQKWVKILMELGKEPEIIDTVANYIASNKKNEAGSFKVFNTILEEKVRIPYNIYLSVKEICERLYGEDQSDSDVFDWVQETILKYYVFNQSKFPSSENIEATFVIIHDYKPMIDFTKKQQSIISSIVGKVTEVIIKKKNTQYAV